MPEKRKVLAGSGTFHEKMYTYKKLARSVAEVRSVLPDHVSMDFMLIDGSRPDMKQKNREALDDAFQSAGTPFTVLDMDNMPGTAGHLGWSSRRIICWKETYLADQAFRRYTDWLSWETDCYVPEGVFAKRLEVWLDHTSRGHVMCAILPYHDPDSPEKQKFMAYNFIPQQIKADEPVEIASFVTQEKPSRKGARLSSKRFKFSNKNDIDDLVLCVNRKSCVPWSNNECQGSDNHCVGYIKPSSTNVYQEAVWAVANPKLKPGRDGLGPDDYKMTMLQNKMIPELFTQPRTPDGLLKAHGGHLGFAWIPAYLFRRIFIRYKPWVHQHPDTWFYFDCAKKGIPVYLDPEIVIEHEHKEWSKEVIW